MRNRSKILGGLVTAGLLTLSGFIGYNWFNQYEHSRNLEIKLYQSHLRESFLREKVYVQLVEDLVEQREELKDRMERLYNKLNIQTKQDIKKKIGNSEGDQEYQRRLFEGMIDESLKNYDNFEMKPGDWKEYIEDLRESDAESSKYEGYPLS